MYLSLSLSFSLSLSLYFFGHVTSPNHSDHSGHKYLGLLLGGVLKMSLSLSIFLVMSCLLITLNKCLKGHKSLGLL